MLGVHACVFALLAISKCRMSVGKDMPILKQMPLACTSLQPTVLVMSVHPAFSILLPLNLCQTVVR